MADLRRFLFTHAPKIDLKKVANIVFVLLCSISFSLLAQPLIVDSTQQKINLLSTKITWHPSEKLLFLERGKLFLQLAKYDSAVADFSFCYKLDSSNIEVKQFLAKALCEQKDSSKSSIGYSIISLGTSLLLDSNCSCAKIKMGTYYLYAGKTDSALYFLKNNLEDTFSKNMLVTDMLGTWYFTDSNYTEALRYLKSSSLEIEGMKALSQYYLGNYEQALSSFDKIEKDSVQDEELLFVRAKCYQKTGQLEKALFGFEQLIKKGYSQNNVVLEERITKLANFISLNWYYLFGLIVTFTALLVTLWKFLRK